MAQFPALPLWTDAYLADCGHLTDAEHGRYLQLLMLMWRAPDCRIPNDDEWLSRKLRRTVDDVKSDIRPIISEFCHCDGNWITQKRLAHEMEYLQKRSSKQSDRAKSRWNKEKDGCRGSTTSGIAPTPTPTPHKPPTPRKRVEDTDTPEFIRFWDVYPLKKEKGAARKAFAKAMTKVDLETLVMKAREYAIDRQRAGMEYVKNPATWLNKECWLDETLSAKKVVRFRQ